MVIDSATQLSRLQKSPRSKKLLTKNNESPRLVVFCKAHFKFFIQELCNTSLGNAKGTPLTQQGSTDRCG